MSLATGTRVGPYEVLGSLGAGGMGEVYRARDTQLNRDVAIKVLPELFAVDAERLARFTREAQLLATLNHPNIAQIYGLERSAASGATRALVMELVEGEDLSAVTGRGPIPLSDAMPIARQIADALEAAHEVGIIHRDLKPANIMVRGDGTVKVLDFGLAKAIDPAGPSSTEAMKSPTLTARATEMGVIIGTAAYMAPEQARGKAVDKRADIWAFGVVLYEMLTGRRLFEGETISDVLAGVLTREPDWALMPAEARHLTPIIARCLEKDPRNRLRDIGDVRYELQRARAGAATATVSRAHGHPAVWLLSLLAAAAAGAVLMRVLVPNVPPTTVPLRVSIPLAPNQQIAAASANPILVFAPDGSSLVMPVVEEGRQWLVRRRLTNAAVERIEGTEGGSAPFFSPDGAWLGFIAGGKLMKVTAEGGRPFVLADQQGAGGAAWGADGRIVFGPTYSDGLFKVSAEGGARARLTTPDHAQGELGHWWPQILPGGQRVLFTAFRSPIDTSRVGVVSLDTGEVRTLVEGGYFARYVRSGHLLYVRGGRLYAAPFDPARAVLTGPAQNVLDDVFSSHSDAASFVDVSVDGTLAWVPGSVADSPRELLWVHRNGKTEPAAAERRRYRGASLSPDGRTLAVAIQGDSLDLWTYSVDRGTLSRVTTGARSEFGPMWSRDGKTLFYMLDRPPFEIQRIAFGASGEGEALWPAKFDTVLSGLSADGRRMIYSLTALETGADVWIASVDGRDPAPAIRSTKYEERFGSFSPDGRWLAYESDESGRPEIYVEAVPGPGGRFQISADGGTEPIWTHGSGEIFYRRGDDMRVVRARTVRTFEFEPARTLFTLSFSRSANHDRNYDVTPDGQRFILSRIPDASAPRRVDLVTHWLDDLARRVPTGR